MDHSIQENIHFQTIVWNEFCVIEKRFNMFTASYNKKNDN